MDLTFIKDLCTNYDKPQKENVVNMMKHARIRSKMHPNVEDFYNKGFNNFRAYKDLKVGNDGQGDIYSDLEEYPTEKLETDVLKHSDHTKSDLYDVKVHLKKLCTDGVTAWSAYCSYMRWCLRELLPKDALKKVYVDLEINLNYEIAEIKEGKNTGLNIEDLEIMLKRVQTAFAQLSTSQNNSIAF